MTELHFQGLVNARDVGGLPLADGGHIRPGRLYRSETPQLMTAHDVSRAVQDLGIRRVVDLRGERGGGSGPLGADGRGLVIDYFELAGGYDRQWDLSAEGFLPSQLELGAPVVGLVMEQLVSVDGATLVHCHTGKDRTGFIIAMILAAVGVPDHEIVGDYVRSSPIFVQMMANLVAAGLGVPDSAPEYARHAPSAAGVTTMLERLRQGWPDPTTYLTSQGVDGGLIQATRTLLAGP